MSKVFNAGAGQAASTTDIYLRNVKLTAGSAAATAIVYGNGVALIKLAALTGTSDSYYATSGGASFSLENIPGPVTVDVVGTGAFLRMSY
jgi:hypothetical protein